jgi:hypothetical protein
MESEMVDFLELIPRPAPGSVNQGLTTPAASFLESLLGNPRETYTGQCQNPTNPSFKKLVATQSVGPFKATGLKVALRSLKQVMADVNNELPTLHALLSSNGMLCCRFRRIGGQVVPPPSAHSWGTAIDLMVDGKTDPQGDKKVMRGLLLLSRFFNARGWVWGATFPVEDAMHFEVSRERLLIWKDSGELFQ